MKRNPIKKGLSMLLATVMVLSMIPLTVLAAAEVETNDSMNQATAISVNTTTTGNLADKNDKDYYKFTLTDNEMIQIPFSYSGSSANHTVELVDASGNSIFSTNLYGSDVASPWNSNRYNLPAGTYYVVITPRYTGSSYTANSETYSFQVIQESDTTAGIRETEDNDSANLADIISVNTTYVGNMDDSDDVDYYKLTLSDNEMIQVSFSYTGAYSNFEIALYDTSMGEIFSQNNYGNDIIIPWNSNRYNLPAGTYYVEISPRYTGSSYTANNTDYTFQVIQESDTTAGIRETEDNDSTNLSDSIQLDTLYVGNMEDRDDEDYYTFTLSSAQSMQVGLTYTGTSSNFKVTIYDSTGDDIYAENLYGDNIPSPWTSDGISLAAGTYKLKISPCYTGSSYTFNNGDYTFYVNNAGSAAPTTTTTTPTIDTTTTTTTTGSSTGTSSWATAEVDAAIALGFVPSTLQSNYQSEITRGEFCQLIIQMLMAKCGTLDYQSVFVNAYAIDLMEEPFTDTSNSYVKIAYALQIVNGTGNGLFSPDNSITRQEAAAMLARAASVFEFTTYSGEVTVFSDAGTLASWATASVNFVSANGIMGGVGDNVFSPYGTYTREQSIMTAYRLYNAFPRDSYSVG